MRHERNIIGDVRFRGMSEVGVVVSPHRCVDDGVAFYRPTSNLIRTDGLCGISGAMYIRLVCRIRPNPKLGRAILGGKANPIWSEGEQENRSTAGAPKFLLQRQR